MGFLSKEFAKLIIEEQEACMSGFFATMFEDFVSGNSAGPSSEVCPLFEGSPFFPEDNVDLLDDITDVRTSRNLGNDIRSNHLLVID